MEKDSHRFSLGAEILPKNERTDEILRQRAVTEAAKQEKEAAAEAARRRLRDVEKKKQAK